MFPKWCAHSHENDASLFYVVVALFYFISSGKQYGLSFQGKQYGLSSLSVSCMSLVCLTFHYQVSSVYVSVLDDT